jgi:uncharacterized protein (DUF58 family)
MIVVDPECAAVSRLFAKKSLRFKAPVGLKSENPIFRRKGSSFNLKSLREYQSFDDLRKIDWKLYGRTDRYYIKEFFEEENERFFLAVDSSASLSVFDLDIYRRFIASLAFIFLELSFSIDLAAFTHRLEQSCLNLKHRRDLPRVLGFLDHLSFSGGTDLVPVLKAVRDRYRPTTLFLFSDLFDPRLEPRHLRPFRRVFLLHFHTPFAGLPLRFTEVEVRDPESGRSLLVSHNPSSRRRILGAEQEFMARFSGALGGCHYLRLERDTRRVALYWRILETLYE